MNKDERVWLEIVDNGFVDPEEELFVEDEYVRVDASVRFGFEKRVGTDFFEYVREETVA